jgi:hypothetical protein
MNPVVIFPTIRGHGLLFPLIDKISRKFYL